MFSLHVVFVFLARVESLIGALCTPAVTIKKPQSTGDAHILPSVQHGQQKPAPRYWITNMHLRIADLVLFRWGHWFQRAVYSAKHASRFSIDETLKKEEKKATQAAVLIVIKDSPSMRNNISSIINKYALHIIMIFFSNLFLRRCWFHRLLANYECVLFFCFF